MNAEEIIRHIGLPDEAVVDRRVPKLVLSAQAGATAKERRLIKQEVESLLWTAVLKPSTVGIRPYSDAECDFSELSVLVLRIREARWCRQLQETVHRSVPYHSLLLTETTDAISVSVANKRRSKSENDRFILDGEVIWTQMGADDPDAFNEEFGTSMSLQTASRQTLRELYLSWINSIVSLEAARITGTFLLSRRAETAEARSSALRAYLTSQREAEAIRKKAKRETQAGRQVELNLALQDLKNRQERAVRTLNHLETPSP